MGLLPDKKTIPKQNFNEYTKLFFGPPGSGKTSTAAASGDDTLMLLFEDGTSGLSVYSVNMIQEARMQGKLPWEIFLDTLDELLETEHNFNEVVIDTADRAYDACMEYTCKTEGFDHPSDEGYGSGWNKLNNNFQHPYRELQMSELGMTIISHAKFKEIENIMGKKHDKIVPSVGGSSGQWLVDEADIVVLFDRDEEDNRILRVEGSKHYDAKQRLQFENGVISAGNSPEEAYDNLLEEFNNSIKRVNDKLGITQEDIDEYYDRQEELANKRTFPQLVNDVKEICKEQGMKKKDHDKLLMDKFGTSTYKKLNYDQVEELLNELRG